MTEKPGEFWAFPPNRARVKVYGNIEEAEISRVLMQVLDFSQGTDFLMLEIDISEMTGATPEARRVSAKIFGEMPAMAFALVGGSFSQRALAKLVLKAVELLRGKKRQVVSFFKESEPAVSWLEQQGEHYTANGRFK
ncbi:MAG: hypothetical protein AAF799_48355 [Myxococcota bacterium]